MGITAGFGEETMCRILSLAIVMRYVKKEKRLALIIVLAVIFGLSHAGNVTQGADLVMSVVQVIHSTFLAFLFTALYLGTGSVIFPIFAHGLHDFISFTTDPSLSADGIIVHQYTTGQLVYELVLAVIIGIAALYLLNKDKLKKANELWGEKWSNI
jgi:membrane protease YdiL (CAAX protease family)